MAMQQIVAKAVQKLEDGTTRTLESSINYDFGETLADLVEKCGGREDVVKSNAIANIVITMQSGIRRMLLKGFDNQAIQTYFDSYAPGTVSPRTTDVTASFVASFQKKSLEEQEADLEKLRALLEARRAAQ